MIGGIDVVVACVPHIAKRTLVGVLLEHWLAAVLEDARSDGLPARLDLVDPASLPDEILIYKDAAAKDAWDREGASDVNADTMIHVLSAEDAVTLVVDERQGSETAKIAADVQRDLAAGSKIRDSFFEGLDAPTSWIEAA